METHIFLIYLTQLDSHAWEYLVWQRLLEATRLYVFLLVPFLSVLVERRSFESVGISFFRIKSSLIARGTLALILLDSISSHVVVYVINLSTWYRLLFWFSKLVSMWNIPAASLKPFIVLVVSFSDFIIVKLFNVDYRTF